LFEASGHLIFFTHHDDLIQVASKMRHPEISVCVFYKRQYLFEWCTAAVCNLYRVLAGTDVAISEIAIDICDQTFIQLDDPDRGARKVFFRVQIDDMAAQL
jgi:hypothetical protein